MIAKALIFAVFCVQAIRFDDKAELASLSALISKLKPKTKNTVGLGNTTGTVLSEVDESAGNGGTIKDLLNEIKNSIIDNKKDAIKQEADHCTDSVDGSVGETELDFGDSTKYFDLVGCDETSTCETGTDKEQTIATDAHARIQALEAALADLENKLKIKQAASTAKTGDIEALEKKKTDNDALHQIRMKKFGDAITILNKIDSGLDESGKITMPEFLQMSKEEKNTIQNFRVGAAILLVLDQATSGVGEKDLVNQLKTLLASCIKSLEGSEAAELKKHTDWIGFLDVQLEGLNKEADEIVTQIADLEGKILANEKETKDEQTKKDNAVTNSNTLRQTCLSEHATFISDLEIFESEIAAIEKMIEILIEAKLDGQTTKIRDETDETKHGVQESLRGDVAGSPAAGSAPNCTPTPHPYVEATLCPGGFKRDQMQETCPPGSTYVTTVEDCEAFAKATCRLFSPNQIWGGGAGGCLTRGTIGHGNGLIVIFNLNNHGKCLDETNAWQTEHKQKGVCKKNSASVAKDNCWQDRKACRYVDAAGTPHYAEEARKASVGGREDCLNFCRDVSDSEHCCQYDTTRNQLCLRYGLPKEHSKWVPHLPTETATDSISYTYINYSAGVSAIKSPYGNGDCNSDSDEPDDNEDGEGKDEFAQSADQCSMAKRWKNSVSGAGQGELCKIRSTGVDTTACKSSSCIDCGPDSLDFRKSALASVDGCRATCQKIQKEHGLEACWAWTVWSTTNDGDSKKPLELCTLFRKTASENPTWQTPESPHMFAGICDGKPVATKEI